MSVTVRHLNADSSFLFTFSPDPESSSDGTTSHHSYSVLVDPWLSGDSIITHPWFAVTKHNIPSSISHLSEIEEPDLVVISQNKPDHCHEETLRQLRPEGKSLFAAEPGAAKAMKNWKYFDPARIFALPRYSPQKKFSVLRIHIPPLAPGGDPGEVTIAFLPAKNYLTGLHNGIGLTYQAPTAYKTLARVCTIDLPRFDQNMGNPLTASSLSPPSPATSPPPTVVRPNTADNSYMQPITSVTDHSEGFGYGSDSGKSQVSDHMYQESGLLSPPFSPTSNQQLLQPSLNSRSYSPPTPPDSPLGSIISRTISSPHTIDLQSPSTTVSFSSNLPTIRATSKKHPARPRPISVLYTPHGVPLSDLLPYVQNHLIPLSALPLTILLHSFSRITNPWYLGGNIMAGSGNGLEIARSLMAKVWLSAHDEEKNDQGVSVKKIKVEGKRSEDVRRMLYQDGDHAENWRKHGWTCDVRDLGVGRSMTISTTEKDLVEGAEKRWMVGQQELSV